MATLVRGLMFYLVAILTAAICSAANVIRGAGQGWMRPVVGLLAGAGHYAATWQIVPSLIIAAGIWLWLTQPWGQWYAFGWRPDRALSSYEAMVERVVRTVFKDEPGLSITSWIISSMLFSLPLAIASSPWWLLLGPASVWFYTVTFRFMGQGPHVRWGEAGKGAIIGLIAVLLAGCAAPQREPDWGGIARETGRILNR